MNKQLFSLFFLAAAATAQAQNYTLTLPQTQRPIVEGKLAMGAKAPDGSCISVNNFYMSMDSLPVIPIMGEFHYSRYPAEEWEQEILKMKAGGINVLPSYVFWNLHEPQEGQWCWTGNRNLRRFIELCARHDMKVIIRIGPFGHGEMRNGGIPDWIMAKPLELRSNDPLYLSYANKLYQAIGNQLRGLYYEDGGPIIGVQIENEMQHSAAPWAIHYPGEPFDYTVATIDASTTKIGVSVQEAQMTHRQEGDDHMQTLKRLAETAGIKAAFYTATGWGNAAVLGNEAIPVTSAYTYPTWAPRALSPFTLFKDLHAHPDYEPVRYRPTDFPSFAAEMGAGIQMTYDRRPVIPGDAGEALMVRCLGSGSNGIGYYMYHGGSTPVQPDGMGTYADQPMGVPKISYDFQAPLGEFGLEGAAYRDLRLLHLFLNDFQHQLAPMQTILPEGSDTITPQNRQTLRYAVRQKSNSGFVFMTNFQDHDTARVNQTGLSLTLNLQNETLRIPSQGSFTLPKDKSLILPFNLHIDDATLRYATAQLLTMTEEQDLKHYFFFVPDGVKPEFAFKNVKGKNIYRPVAGLNSTFTVKTKGNKQFMITTLTRQQARNAIKIDGKVLITEAAVIPQGNNCVKLLSIGNPQFTYTIFNGRKPVTKTVVVSAVEPQFRWEKVGERRVKVRITEEKHNNVEECFLQLDYTGDICLAFINGRFTLDHFWQGQPWMIGLNRFAKNLAEDDFTFYIRPLKRDAPYLSDLPREVIPDFSHDSVLKVNGVKVIPQYKTFITL